MGDGRLTVRWLAGFVGGLAVAVVTGPMAGCEEEEDPCVVTMRGIQEVSCGTYQVPDAEEDPCNEQFGEGPQGPQCLSLTERNAEVLACVLSAATDGEALTFAQQTGDLDGQFATTTTFHGAADGRLWRETYVAEDLCNIRSTALYERIDLASCRDWQCVRELSYGAEQERECEPEVLNCESF